MRLAFERSRRHESLCRSSATLIQGMGTPKGQPRGSLDSNFKGRQVQSNKICVFMCARSSAG